MTHMSHTRSSPAAIRQRLSARHLAPSATRPRYATTKPCNPTCFDKFCQNLCLAPLQQATPSACELNSCSCSSVQAASKMLPRLLQVLLCAGLDEAAQKALTEGTSSSDHLHKLLKFLIVRAERGGKREGIMCIGGPVDPAIDGNPADGYACFQFCMPACDRHTWISPCRILRPVWCESDEDEALVRTRR